MDYPPRVLNAAAAVYPFYNLQAGTDGSAELAFYVSPTGHVVQPTLRSAYTPEFGQAALAMIDQCTFQPASTDGKPVLGVMRMKVVFSISGGDAPLSDSARSILRELKRKTPEIVALSETDGKPAPISRNKPVFPSILVDKIDHGDALIEFFIDTAGYARLPRIVSASEEAFGYSAAQAVSTWRFKPLKKQGRPVVVKIQIPVKFELKPAGDPPAARNEK